MAAVIEARDKMYSIANQGLADITQILGYQPQVIWGLTDSAVKVSSDLYFMIMQNLVTDNRQITMGRPKLYRWEGTFNIQVYSPKKAGINQNTELTLDAFNKAFMCQDTFGALKIRNISVGEQPSAYGSSNRTDLNVNYLYHYYLQAAA